MLAWDRQALVRTPAFEVAALTRTVVWIGGLALAFGGAEIVTALVARNARLLVAGVATASVAVGARIACTWGSRGKVTSAGLLVAYHLLGLCVIATVALPFAYPVLLVTTLMAVALVLPYVRGRPLHALLGSAAIASALVVGSGAVFERSLVPSWWVELLCDVCGGVAGAALVLWLLGQFSSRLWRSVEQQNASERRMRLLADASALLAESLAYHDTLARVAQMAVPGLADWCAVTILGADGHVEHVVGAHADRARQAELDALLHRPADPARSQMLLDALRLPRADAELSEALAEAWLKAVVPGGSERMMRELVRGALWIVPLQLRGEPLGVLTLAREEKSEPFNPEALLLAEELARRAALAIDHARLFRTQKQLARTREEFLTVAAHELKTPLTSLGLLLSGIVREAEAGRGGQGPSTMVEKVSRAQRQVRKLSELVSQLLDISRIDRGRLELQREPLDLAVLVREVVGRVRPLLEGAACEVQLNLEEGVVGNWDCTRLDQVLTNLIGNAARYGAGRPITVTVERIEDGARLAVRDEGVGIEPGDQVRIFQPFERAASVEHYGGLGLGLWITRGIVQEHGGSIRVSSRPGAGSTFVVELPLGLPRREEGRIEPEPAHPPAEHPSGGHLLSASA